MTCRVEKSKVLNPKENRGNEGLVPKGNFLASFFKVKLNRGHLSNKRKQSHKGHESYIKRIQQVTEKELGLCLSITSNACKAIIVDNQRPVSTSPISALPAEERASELHP